MLMKEHRLIERMLALMNEELSRIREKGEADPVFIDTCVDFLRTYADRTHHGKEEEIYFRDLVSKDMAPERHDMIKELMSEHAYARNMVKVLKAANARYADGEADALEDILSSISELAGFYPAHIAKEDKQLFLPTQKYFGPEELAAMLAEFIQFDAEMIHARYRDVVERYEGQ